MIEIFVETDKTGFVFKIKGHAGAAKKGEDLVCCACSTLFYTLANRESELGFLDDWKAETGDGMIKAHGKGCLSVLRTIMSGYEILAKQFPAYIKIMDWCTSNPK